MLSKMHFLWITCISIMLLQSSRARKLIVFQNDSCSPQETKCTFGCCPFENGECCPDGSGCCEKGTTCLPFISVCVGGKKDVPTGLSIFSKRSTPLARNVLSCPSGQTDCGPSCCPLPDAVCCSDGLHCCPAGYTCDLSTKTCNPGRSLKKFVGEKLFKTSRKSMHKSCPQGKICPAYMSCCLNEDDGWGCCPNPFNGLYLKQTPDVNQCCDTIFGHMCCPPSYPICTIFGCTN